MKTRPNLFIPGFAKCGTSYLHAILDSHDEISMTKVKETHNFVLDKNYYRLTNPEFSQNFDYMFENKNSKYKGESSTLNIMDSKFIKRIYEFCENPKFIIMLRDPIDRITSHFNWMSYLGNVKLPYKEEILFDINKAFDPNINFNGNYKNYILFSSYYKVLTNIKEFFPNSFIIINLESLKSDFPSTINHICNFLEINNLFNYNNTINTKVNETPKIKLSKKPLLITIFSKLISSNLKNFLKDYKFIRKQILKFQRTQYFYNPSLEEELFLFKVLENDILLFQKEYPSIVSQWEKTNFFLNQK